MGAFYTPDHVRSILRRVAANKGGRPATTLSTILWFYLMIIFEGVHPLEGGAFRLKFRRDRRYSLPPENPLIFYPRYLGDIVRKAWGYWSVYVQYKKILRECLQAPDRWTYSDLALLHRAMRSLTRLICTRRPAAATRPWRRSDRRTQHARRCAQLRYTRATSSWCAARIQLWSVLGLAEVKARLRCVRSSPSSRHHSARSAGPFSATSGRTAKKRHSSQHHSMTAFHPRADISALGGREIYEYTR